MLNKCDDCGKCCLGTEMVLSNKDIDLITKTSLDNISRHQFSFKNDDGCFQLLNEDDHCIFFEMKSKKCKIYEFRPQGCRFYPLIYDFQQSKCIFDIDCPRPHLFYQNKKIFREVCKKIREFLKSQLKIA
ncbi:MAG: YkgJ family cysteine cluster protein [Promethearchaeota archaeon]